MKAHSIIGTLGLGFALVISGCGDMEDGDEALMADTLESEEQALANGDTGDDYYDDSGSGGSTPTDCNALKKNGNFICQVSYSAAVIHGNFTCGSGSAASACLSDAEKSYIACWKKVDVAYALCLASP